jgi:hypothetical protein
MPILAYLHPRFNVALTTAAVAASRASRSSAAGEMATLAGRVTERDVATPVPGIANAFVAVGPGCLPVGPPRPCRCTGPSLTTIVGCWPPWYRFVMRSFDQRYHRRGGARMTSITPPITRRHSHSMRKTTCTSGLSATQASRSRLPPRFW